MVQFLILPRTNSWVFLPWPSLPLLGHGVFGLSLPLMSHLPSGLPGPLASFPAPSFPGLTLASLSYELPAPSLCSHWATDFWTPDPAQTRPFRLTLFWQDTAAALPGPLPCPGPWPSLRPVEISDSPWHNLAQWALSPAVATPGPASLSGYSLKPVVTSLRAHLSFCLGSTPVFPRPVELLTPASEEPDCCPTVWSSSLCSSAGQTKNDCTLHMAVRSWNHLAEGIFPQ